MAIRYRRVVPYSMPNLMAGGPFRFVTVIGQKAQHALAFEHR